jgi:hypothetical protein
MLRFRYHRLRHELTNYSLFNSRHVDGQIVSQHQSGTHWLKYMMANALSHHHSLPPPKYNHANDFIGGPKDPIVYPNIPHLISSHSVPPIIAPWLIASRGVQLPKYILLVRDIRASLVSNYRKWQQRYDQSFSEFLRGDPAGRKYNSDIWWSIRFLNAWHRMLLAHTDNILMVHYESLLENPKDQLSRSSDFLNLGLSSKAISVGIENATKDRMKARADPARPDGEVNESAGNISDWFNSSDRLFFSKQCRKFLSSDYGYDYESWQ